MGYIFTIHAGVKAINAKETEPCFLTFQFGPYAQHRVLSDRKFKSWVYERGKGWLIHFCRRKHECCNPVTARPCDYDSYMWVGFTPRNGTFLARTLITAVCETHTCKISRRTSNTAKVLYLTMDVLYWNAYFYFQVRRGFGFHKGHVRWDQWLSALRLRYAFPNCSFISLGHA